MARILHISNTDINSDSRILKELNAMSVLDAEISVVGIPDNHDSLRENIKNVRYVKVKMISRYLGFLPRAIRYVFELIEFTVCTVWHGYKLDVDVVHCHDAFALPSGFMLKKIKAKKLIYDAHELESNKAGQNLILRYATYFIEKICWNNIDLFVSVSDSIIEWYMNSFGRKPSVLVLNSPVIKADITLSNNQTNSDKYFHKKYDLPEDSIIFVYLGILNHGRGIEICLDAFASGPINAHVVFVGKGPLEMKISEYERKYKNIHMHSPVQHDKVVTLVANANYGLCMLENVSLSDYYSLPNKLFEYAFAGLPILASKFPEIKKLVDEHDLGSYADINVKSVREAISRLALAAEKKKQIGMEKLSWDFQAAKLVDSYRNIIF